MTKHESQGKDMRKPSFSMFVCAALAVLAGLSAPARSPAAADWSQYQHDAARTGASPARGPVWPRVPLGWPVSCGRCTSGPLISQVTVPGEVSPRQAIFTGSSFVRTIFGFDSLGQPLPGNWPAVLGPESFGGSIGFPVVQRSGDETLVFAAEAGETTRPARVFGLSGGGEPLPGLWPWQGPDLPLLQIPSPLALVDGSSPAGKPEGALYFAYGSWESTFLTAVGMDGAERPGWPVEIGAPGSSFGAAVGPSGTIYIPSAAQGPQGRQWVLNAYAPNGRPRQGWPVPLGGEDVTVFGTGPSVAANGTAYIAVLAGPPGTGPSRYYAVTPNGHVKEGFPVALEDWAIGTPAIAPGGTTFVTTFKFLSGGNRLASVFAFDPDGQVRPGWPLSFKGEGPSGGWIFGLAVDATGRVYFADGNTVYAYNRQGHLLRGWPLTIPGIAWLAYPALADDGTLYLVGGTAEGEGRIYALRSGAVPHPGIVRPQEPFHDQGVGPDVRPGSLGLRAD